MNLAAHTSLVDYPLRFLLLFAFLGLLGSRLNGFWLWRNLAAAGEERGLELDIPTAHCHGAGGRRWMEPSWLSVESHSNMST